MLTGLPARWDACSRMISFPSTPSAFAHHGDTIAVGLGSQVGLIDAITGAGTSALHGHTTTILSIEFSLDGTLLVSRCKDNTVKLWDIQTGGAIRTLSDHTCVVSAIAISPDGTTIVLGTTDGLIRLWDVRTGKCHPINTHRHGEVNVVRFSPADSQRFIFSSRGGAIQQLDLDGREVGTSYREDYEVDDLTYASDGNRFVSCGTLGAFVQDSESMVELVRLRGFALSRCCFSPDGRFVACSSKTTICVWNITTRRTPLVEYRSGHSESITFLAFPSTLVSGSSDRSVKFWQSSSFLAIPKTTGHMAALGIDFSDPIVSVKLSPGDNTLVTSHRSGWVKTLNLTMRTRKKFATPASGRHDTHLDGNTFIIAWYADTKNGYQYHLWDLYKSRLLWVRGFSRPSPFINDLKISQDGSKIFGLTDTHIEILCTQRSEARRVEVGGRRASNLFVRGSQVGISNSGGMGWDFGTSEVPSFGELPDWPRLNLVDRSRGGAVEPCGIEDTVTKRAVFHLPETYMKLGTKVEWDGRYLLIWSSHGEGVVVIDFDSVRRSLDTTR